MQVRSAGLLLHPTSLPNGCLDNQAWLLIDWMAKAGLSIWQTLPLTKPNSDLSPYNSLSAFALNPRLLPPNWQAEFTAEDEQEFDRFLANPPHWLDDYALFMALRRKFNNQAWWEWPVEYKTRQPEVLQQARELCSAEILGYKKNQFAIIQLWQKLKAYAATKGVQLFGDMPIFVAMDSVDVWANPNQFLLNDELKPTFVAGVPPDYFSETGQRWGNPQYNWQAMEADGFDWWSKRVAASLEMYDLVRIDHFRGLEASWFIKAEEPTAINGEWVQVPGAALLNKLQQLFDPLPLVAEDLGVITQEVVDLKNQFNLPGMSVLQFGFNGLPDNPHSPHELVQNSVLYTGTHDNDTTMGWFNSLHDDTKNWVLSQLANDVGEMPWPLIATAMRSVADRVIVPLQDFLALGSEHRMNIPGTIENNWKWQFDWHQVPEDLADKIYRLVEESERLNSLQQKA